MVEGFISNGPQPTIISLTRTTLLYNAPTIIHEHNALVNIESDNNEIFPLTETGDGVYTSSALNLDATKKYRLQIKTLDGKEYVSDFSTVKHTPAIDSISWLREAGGVRLYINSHDPQNNTRYYQWKYEETWEVHSAYESSLIYSLDPLTHLVTGIEFRYPVTRAIDTSIIKCWQSNNSTSIILGTSEKLTADKIYLPLLSIEPATEKLSVLYSIKVSQYALSHEAYKFLQNIKSNTEQLGSLFDPQPSELQGNIHCTTNPAELVVGYIDVTEERQQRIFISNSDVPGWNYYPPCESIVISNNIDSINKYGQGRTPTTPFLSMGANVISFSAANTLSCVDCTIKGTNIKPSFWP